MNFKVMLLAPLYASQLHHKHISSRSAAADMAHQQQRSASSYMIRSATHCCRAPFFQNGICNSRRSPWD
uniref:Uncharacterized protein n=1 Tax=Setaria italica TaxID=4555 RepID=K4AHN8_SETIT